MSYENAKRVMRLNRKLTIEKAQYIREALASGRSKRSLATEFGVSRTTIRMTARGDNWKLYPFERAAMEKTS